MQRVLSALREKRCLIAASGNLQSDQGFQSELLRLGGLGMVHLGARDGSLPSLTADALQPCLERPGGLVVLLDPSPSEDGKALQLMAEVIRKSKNKPKVLVVGRRFNPFGLPQELRAKSEMYKAKILDFVRLLPSMEAQPAAASEKKKAVTKERVSTPRPVVVGREEEVTSLRELIAAGGPVVVCGPSGIGRRWVVEQALKDGERSRWPDLVLGRGFDFDSTLARIAVMSGSESLKAALKDGAALPLEDRLSACVEALSAESMSQGVLLVRGLDGLCSRQGELLRQDRMGLLVERLLAGGYSASVIFITEQVPQVFQPAISAQVPRLEIKGLKGRDMFPLFESLQAGHVSRDRLGPMCDRVMGHPMAARAYAQTWLRARDDQHRQSLWTSKRMPRFIKGGSAETLQQHLKKQVDALKPEVLETLQLIAQLRTELKGSELGDMGIPRKHREELLSRGLLESLPFGEVRSYSVHALVRSQLPRPRRGEGRGGDWRVARAERLLKLAASAEGVESLRLRQEANRQYALRRFYRSMQPLEFPDHDGLMEVVRDLLSGLQRERSRGPKREDKRRQRGGRDGRQGQQRGRQGQQRGREDRSKQQLSRAEELLRRILKRDPMNTEARLLEVELRALQGRKEEQEQLLQKLFEDCPTPHAYHQRITTLLRAKAQDAAEALARAGMERYPKDPALLQRLGSMLAKRGDLEGARSCAHDALELDSTNPEAYALLAELDTARGPAHWESASEALKQALDLNPDAHRFQLAQARLLFYRGILGGEQRPELWAEAKLILEESLKSKRDDSAMLLAELLLSIGGEHERVQWLLDKAAARLGKTWEFQALQSRALALSGQHRLADQTLQRLLSKRGQLPEVQAAQAETLFARGRVFQADQLLQEALNAAGEELPARQLWTELRERVQACITQGTAADLERQAEEIELRFEQEAAAEAEAAAAGAAEGKPAEGGSERKSRSRKRSRSRNRKQRPDRPQLNTGLPAEAAAEAAPAEAAAEAAPAEAAAEAAPAEAAPPEGGEA